MSSKMVHVGTLLANTPGEAAIQDSYYSLCRTVSEEAHRRGMTLQGFTTLRLGKPACKGKDPVCVVWDRPTWRLRLMTVPEGEESGYEDPTIFQAQRRQSFVLEVPEGTPWETVLDALQDFRALIDPELELRQEAQALVDPILKDMVPYEVVHSSDDELRKFVLAYTSSQVFTSIDLEERGGEHLLGQLFMPIVFGALAHPDWPLPAKPSKPEAPVPPLPPTSIPEPPTPDERQYDEALVAEVVRLENALDWDESVEAELVAARQTVEADRKAVDEFNAGLLGQRRILLDSWEAANDALQAGYQKELAEFNAASSTFNLKQETEKYDRFCRVLEMAGNLLVNAYFRDLGIIWEYMDQAGPRAINGYPMFFSCRMMHREDWERARVAINREFERRQTVEL